MLLRREVTGLKWEINRAQVIWARFLQLAATSMSDSASPALVHPGGSSGGASVLMSAIKAGSVSLDSSDSVLKKLLRNGYVYELQSGSSPAVWKMVPSEALPHRLRAIAGKTGPASG